MAGGEDKNENQDKASDEKQTLLVLGRWPPRSARGNVFFRVEIFFGRGFI
jgi:hypothetical protein